ncbi:MAG: rod shape-determining protein RodA [Alphaproteobacteria bacterium]|nr:MAG: rod shape-determining protein RodA [Alphaproteobacteria bacterium]
MSYIEGLGSGGRDLRLMDKFFEINWGFILLLCLVAGLGFIMLYSVAGGQIDPWASRQMIRFGAGMAMLFVIALIDIRVWMVLAYPAYAVALILLVSAEFIGVSGMGAKRWIELGPIQLQPAEFMKIAMVLTLARYFHGISLEQVSRLFYLLPPLLIIALPVMLVLRQPDLGTAALLAIGGCLMLFIAGLNWKVITSFLVLGVAAVPVGWQMLYDYQKDRIFMFLDPTRDPLGAGYNIIQSKIALGSGGVFGKGFGEGTQSQLNFLPEKHTDFIFTMLGEELGLMGASFLLGLYILLLGYGIAFALESRNHFGRLVAIGVCLTFFLYIFINVAMVMGLVPVVGVPLPLVSYGGTAMLTLLFGFGLLMCVHIHRGVELPRNSIGLW